MYEKLAVYCCAAIRCNGSDCSECKQYFNAEDCPLDVTCREDAIELSKRLYEKLMYNLKFNEMTDDEFMDIFSDTLNGVNHE